MLDVKLTELEANCRNAEADNGNVLQYEHVQHEVNAYQVALAQTQVTLFFET